MKTLNIWEVRAEAGRKEPFLDVTENVVADTFAEASAALQALIAERIVQYPEHFKEGDSYAITCVRLIQQVKTLDSKPSTPAT